MNKNTEKISSLFDEWAGKPRGESMAKGHDELVLDIYEGWDFNNVESVLDLGCGNGRALGMAKERGAKEISGLDLSENMVKTAKKNLPEGIFEQGSIEELPFADNSFSHIMSIEALYYVGNLEKAFSEIARVLKPGGKFAMAIDYYEENIGSHVWKDCLGFDIHLLSGRKWLELLDKARIKGAEQSRIKRKEFKSEEDFQPSNFFPSYKLYQKYQEAGALKLSN